MDGSEPRFGGAHPPEYEWLTSPEYDWYISRENRWHTSSDYGWLTPCGYGWLTSGEHAWHILARLMTRTTDGYRKISLHNHDIEVPGVPLREEVEIHMVPDLARGAMEIKIWWENRMKRSVVYPLKEFPRVHF